MSAFTLFRLLILFPVVNSHLAAGESRQDVLSRNNHHRSIATRTYFKHVKVSHPRQIDDHEYVFYFCIIVGRPTHFSAIIWLGDLNYRISVVKETPNNSEFSHVRHDNELVRYHASNANFDWLLGFDEVCSCLSSFTKRLVF